MAWKKGLLVSIATSVLLLTACSPGGGNTSSGSASAPSSDPKAGSSPATDSDTNKKVELRITWWGSQVRHDATLKVIDLFEKKNPNIKLNAEYLGSDGYWDKLNTQIAGGNAPDIIQMGNNFPDYVAKNALLDISSFEGKEIDLKDFEKATVDGGKLDGKLYGINLGSNAFGIAYNTALIQKAGMQPPTGNWTWEEYGKYANDLSKALGKGSYGAIDESGMNTLYLTYYARQSGKTLYKDGKVGLDKDVFANWFTMWDNFRKAGGVPPAEFTAGFSEQPDNSAFVQGKVVMKLIWSNLLTAYQKVMKDEINLVMPPNGGTGATQGLWLQPSQFMTINAKSKNPKEAAMFISFMVNDPEATAILGSERGVPGSSKVRDALKAKATPLDKKMYDYVDLAAKNSRVNDREIPNGAEVQSTLTNLGQQIAFGKKSIADAAQELHATAEKVINKK